MIGRYGERISIYSEDLSVPTHTNEFGFVRHNFVTNDGIEHVKKIISLFIQETSGFCVHPFRNWNFITRSTPVELKLL